MKSRNLCFTITVDDDNTQGIEFAIKRLKRDEILYFRVHTIYPCSRTMLRNKSLDLSEINLIDLRNFQLAIELRGQPDERFDLCLISNDNNLLCKFGIPFSLSSSGKFLLGSAFWLKYYSLITKKLNRRNGFMDFSYNYHIPYSKPFSFRICKLITQWPTIEHFSIVAGQNSLRINMEIEKLPLNTLSLYIFSSDFSHQVKHCLEDERRIPSQGLRIDANFTLPEFASEGILYAFLTVSDKILSELKQINLKPCANEKHLGYFVDFLYRHLAADKNKGEFGPEIEQIPHRLVAIFHDQTELTHFISFLNKPEIKEIFRAKLVEVFLQYMPIVWKLLVKTDYNVQIKIIPIIIDCSALDFFYLSAIERKSLRNDLSRFTLHSSFFGKLIRVKLYGYEGLEEEEKKWLAENDFIPPFIPLQPIVKEIIKDLQSLDQKILDEIIKIGELNNSSGKLKKWYFNLKMNANEFSDLFGHFYNYWLTEAKSERKAIYSKTIVSVLKKNPDLFCHLMILTEIVYQWETNRLKESHESFS